jgi:phytoene dehydrogenase-like protein
LRYSRSVSSPSAGRPDSLAAARTCLAHTCPPDDDPTPLETLLTRGDEAIHFLVATAARRLRPLMTYPDDQRDRPGATPGGRVPEPMPFDARTLGADFTRLRPLLPEFTLFGAMMIHRSDIPHLRRAARSPASAWHVARLFARQALERLRAPRGTTLHLGKALAGGLFRSARELGVEVRTGTAVPRLLREQGRVCGAVIATDGAPQRVRARRGRVPAHAHRPRQAGADRGRPPGPALRPRGAVVPRGR